MDSNEEKPQLRVVFCTEHQSVWGDEEESFSIEDEHCQFWYWMSESREDYSYDAGKCVPVNATISWKEDE